MGSLRREIEIITERLKLQGDIPYTPEELLKKALDRQTPDRRKGCCTELDGRWYRIRYAHKDSWGYWVWIWESIEAGEVDAKGSYIHPGQPAATR